MAAARLHGLRLPRRRTALLAVMLGVAFPPGNPYNITTMESTDYSQNDPFTVPFGVCQQTAANDRGQASHRR